MKPLSHYALGYVLWAVVVVMAGLVGLIFRESLTTGIVLIASQNMGVDQSRDFYLGYQLRAIEPWTYVFYGLAMIAAIAIVEHYFREGVTKGKLLPRFLLVTGIILAVLTVSQIANFIYSVSLGQISWVQGALTLVELIVSIIFIWLSRRLQNHPAVAD